MDTANLYHSSCSSIYKLLQLSTMPPASSSVTAEDGSITSTMDTMPSAMLAIQLMGRGVSASYLRKNYSAIWTSKRTFKTFQARRERLSKRCDAAPLALAMELATQITTGCRACAMQAPCINVTVCDADTRPCNSVCRLLS